MRKIFLLALLAVFSSSAVADWVSVGNAGGEMTTYVSPATILREGDRVKISYMHDYKTVQESAGERYQSATFQAEFDCKETKSRILSYWWYAKNKGLGDVVYADSSPTNWSTVFPDTEAEAILKYACEKRWWHF